MKRVLLLWNAASALHPGNLHGVPPCCSLETRAPVRERFPVSGWKLFRRVWSAVGSLHSEPKPLPWPRSKPPDLVTAHSGQFRRFPRRLENDLASVVGELAWDQRAQFTRHHILCALLLPAEAALLVLGVALLLWHWRDPATFLMLGSGLGVFLVGGTLVAYPNSVPPLINHWTPPSQLSLLRWLSL